MLAAPPTKCGVPKQRSSHSVDVKSAGLREQLLRILKGKSVHRGTFTLASGAQSDLYIDAKETTADPEGLILVGRVGWQLVKDTAARLQVRVDSIGVTKLSVKAGAHAHGICPWRYGSCSRIQTSMLSKNG